MFNINSLKVPNYNKLSASHRTNSRIFFVISKTAPDQNIRFSRNTNTIPENTEVLVLEHGVGFRGRYSQIKYGDDIGYVLTAGLEQLQNIKPFFTLSTNAEDYPNINSNEIDWKKQNPMIVYLDEQKGSYVVHYELQEITSFSNEVELAGYMNLAREKATEIILKNAGKKNDFLTLNKLLNDYYLFSTAEEWYIDPRPCSTLRVAVSIPARYLNSDNSLLVDDRQSSQEEPSTIEGISDPPPDKYFTLSFQSYIEYKQFFDKLIERLENFNVTFVTRIWSIEPESVSINLKQEVEEIKKFVSSLDKLLKTNYPQFFTSERIDIFSTPKEIWKKSLDLIIDKEDISLTTVKYYDEAKRYSLIAGYSNFLRSQEVLNKTTINYILKFNVERDSLNAEKVLKYAFTGEQEEDLRKFLKEKHYPQVINISPQPLDLFNCTVDTIQRINDLKKIKIPSEIKKYEALNRKYEANKKKKEADLFIRSLTDLTTVKDKNFRILFGIDPPPGKTPNQQLSNYVAVAKTLDWARFVGIAAQCLSKNLPPEVVAELLKKYQEARKFIEKTFLATVCNPYVKNGLKLINGFDLPAIPTYNPNRSLADEIERAVVKLLNDLLAEGIKRALKAASSACLENPNNNFNPNLNLNPIDQAANVNDPAINGLLDDFSNSLNVALGISKEDAKEKLKNILSDITACLTLQEICKLYKGETLNDEVYQLISSLVKRKYGSPYAEKFNNKSYIINFFFTLGTRLDLAICEDIFAPELPIPTSNILCDTGEVLNLRKQILSDKNIPPELIDDLLSDIRNKETKNLEDILNILNSDNPFDFSSAPDLGCKVFPNGQTLGPSPESFSKTLDSMFNSVYNSFDREAEEWYKTTYSIRSSKQNFLSFNRDTGQIEVGEMQVTDEQRNTIKANSGKTINQAEMENNSTGSTGAEEIKLPSYIFKNELQKNTNEVLRYVTSASNNYILFSSSLSGYKQQQLDTAVITENLRKEIVEGEQLLSLFSQQLLFLINAKIFSSATTLLTDLEIESIEIPQDILEITNLIRAIDIYARSNIADSQDLTLRLDNLYKKLGFSDSQEANALFAADEGAAVYLKVCEQIKTNKQKLTDLIGISTRLNSTDSLFVNSNYDLNKTVNELLNDVLTQYNNIINYYKAVLRSKVSYPDFYVEYSGGLQNILLREEINSNKQPVTAYSYYNNNLYDLDQILVKRNDKTYFKISQANKVKNSIVDYITSSDGLNIQDLSNINKEQIFNSYISKKIQQYGFTKSGGRINNEENSIEQFKFINEKLYDGIKQRILAGENKNKFLYLKDSSGLGKASIAESGSGQPYTQYLQLVIPQTPEQKSCNIRPHYLDIDSIKNDVITEKENNVCIEKIVDEKVKNNQTINAREIQKMETNGTQKTMLRGAYRLALRTFLHDILLRSIAIFGRYDPQSLREENNFIEFMSSMTESEMRGMDNGFYSLFTNFLLQSYKEENPDELITNELLKKKVLFKDAVKNELSNYVLPKLAKRIDVDTNLKLVSNIPADNPIKLINIFEDLFNLDLLVIKNNSVYLKIKNKILINSPINTGNIFPNSILTDFQIIEQKIFENTNSTSETDTIFAFLNSPDAELLFKYLFPVTKTLNYFFMINCLSTSTRRQIIQAFRDTKKEIITVCKIIQTNGQPIAADPNNAQSVMDENIAEILTKFIIKALVKTPINIVKGMAETSEPNIAIVSTGFKAAKALKPDLTSFIIPATSLPLGLIPTPITSPLPFINPILAGVYFGTLAWYDDSASPLEQALQNLENNIIGKQEVICSKDTKNNDQHYLIENKPIEIGNYKLQSNELFTKTFAETTPEQIKQELKEQAILKILDDETIKLVTYFTEEEKRQYILPFIQLYNIASIKDVNFSKALEDSRKKIIEEEQRLNVILLIDYIKQEKSGFTFPNPYRTEDETQASYKGGIYLDVWLYAGKPSSYLALEELLNTQYRQFIEKKIILSGNQINPLTKQSLFVAESVKQGQTFKDWIKQQFPGIKFFGE